MKRATRIGRLFLAGCLLFLADGCGKGSGGGGGPGLVEVTGRAVDTAMVPIGAATVVFYSDPVQVVTGDDGIFTAYVAPGTHRLTVSAAGREIHDGEVEIPAGEHFDLGDVLPGDAYFQQRLTVRDHGRFASRFTDGDLWCGVSVADSQGKPVTGLQLEDFQVSEAIVRRTDGEVMAEAAVPLAAQAEDLHLDAGVFERSVTSAKLDVVFLVDRTGSLGDEADIQGRIKRFVDRLAAEHVDFRVAGVSFEEAPRLYHFGFYGPMEMDRIYAEIEEGLQITGDWWAPTCAYDAILFTPWLGFRPDARKVLVVIADIVPQTVYGTYWYSLDATTTTRTAVEKFLSEQDAELFFAMNPNEDVDIELYWRPDINPRAGSGNPEYGVEGSGFDDLTWSDGRRAVALGWPFEADTLWSALQVPQLPVRDSLYQLSWYTTFDWYDSVSDLSDNPQDYDYRVTISWDDPEQPGRKLTAEYTEPVELPTATAVVELVDEEGHPTEAESYLYLGRAGRPEHMISQIPLDGPGRLQIEDLVPGNYRLIAYDSGLFQFGYDELRRIGRLDFDLPAEGADLRLEVETAEHETDEDKLIGLAHDLDDWRLSGDPYRKFSRSVSDWLYACGGGAGQGILCDGMSWREQAAIRHLTMALAGYANLNEYAQIESQRAIEDFRTIIQQVGDVVLQIRKLQRDTQLSWYENLGSELLKALYDALSFGSVGSTIEVIETALDDLIEYAADEFFSDLLDEIKDRLIAVAGIDADSPVVSLIDTGVDLYRQWEFGSEGFEQNLALVWNAVERLGLRPALQAASEAVGDELVSRAFDELQFDDPLAVVVKELLGNLLAGIGTGNGFAGFDDRLRQWSQQTFELLGANRREDLVAAVDLVFDEWDQRLGELEVPQMFRDFVLGFTHDLAIRSVPMLDNGQAAQALQVDDVAAVLIKHAVFSLLLRELFVDEFQRGLESALARARALAASTSGFDREAWSQSAIDAFSTFREAIDTAQQQAWDALSLQDSIDRWSESLEGLQAILVPLADALEVVGSIYPPLQQASDNVRTFSSVLDGIQVLVKAIEFGLKLKCLDDFGQSAETLYQLAY